jgi:hypothetical protein
MSFLDDIHAKQTRYQDAMVATFKSHLQEIIQRATAHVTAKLADKLSITDGVIDQTPGNIKVLRNANNLFMKEINDAGYTRLVNAFTNEFPGQLPFLQDTIAYLGERVKEKWPSLKFKQDDLKVFDAVRLNAVSSLETVMEAAAGSAMTRGMFSVGGMKFSDLVETLADKLAESVPQAVTIADTSTSVFYRTMADRAYQAIQEGQPKERELKFIYSGPNDAITRDFCAELLDEGDSYTRDEIDGLDNEQLDSVWLTGGGWNCRHQWIMDTSEWEAQAQAA